MRDLLQKRETCGNDSFQRYHILEEVYPLRIFNSLPASKLQWVPEGGVAFLAFLFSFVIFCDTSLDTLRSFPFDQE